jgi:hypothetical protein
MARARRSSTIATAGASASSCSVNPRPARSLIPSVAKYSGVTVRVSTFVSSSALTVAFSKRNGLVCPLTSGIRFTRPAFATPGTARTASTSRA